MDPDPLWQQQRGLHSLRLEPRRSAIANAAVVVSPRTRRVLPSQPAASSERLRGHLKSSASPRRRQPTPPRRRAPSPILWKEPQLASAAAATPQPTVRRDEAVSSPRRRRDVASSPVTTRESGSVPLRSSSAAETKRREPRVKRQAAGSTDDREGRSPARDSRAHMSAQSQRPQLPEPMRHDRFDDRPSRAVSPGPRSPRRVLRPNRASPEPRSRCESPPALRRRSPKARQTEERPQHQRSERQRSAERQRERSPAGQRRQSSAGRDADQLRAQRRGSPDRQRGHSPAARRQPPVERLTEGPSRQRRRSAETQRERSSAQQQHRRSSPERDAGDRTRQRPREMSPVLRGLADNRRRDSRAASAGKPRRDRTNRSPDAPRHRLASPTDGATLDGRERRRQPEAGGGVSAREDRGRADGYRTEPRSERPREDRGDWHSAANERPADLPLPPPPPLPTVLPPPPYDAGEHAALLLQSMTAAYSRL